LQGERIQRKEKLKRENGLREGNSLNNGKIPLSAGQEKKGLWEKILVHGKVAKTVGEKEKRFWGETGPGGENLARRELGGKGGGGLEL